MVKLNFSELTRSTLESIVQLSDETISPKIWETMFVELTAAEIIHLENIKSHLLNVAVDLMNEATVWARAIYPLLLLAEHENIQAWSEVVLKAKYANFELEGVVDGVLGRTASGLIATPYLIVVEAKRGVEASYPQFQLYGQMLAAAHLNAQENKQDTQEIYGCYTIADDWTFVMGKVSDMDSEKPNMSVKLSRAYAERLEAETILRILKFIVAKRFQ